MSNYLGCCVKTSHVKQRPLHSFPRDPELAKQWCLAMGISSCEKDVKRRRLCDVHFAADQKFSAYKNKTNLICGAMPSLYPEDTKPIGHTETKAEDVLNNGSKPIGRTDAEDVLSNAGMDHDYFSNSKDEETIFPVCRFCLTTIQSVHMKKLYNTDDCDENSENAEEVIKMMSDFLGMEVNLNISVDPVMCLDCLSLLQCSYEFKRSVLDVEEKLIGSCLNEGNLVDLNSYIEGKIDNDISEKDTYSSLIPKKTRLEHFQKIDRDIKIDDKEIDEDCFGDDVSSLSQQNVRIEPYLSPSLEPYLCHICGFYFDRQKEMTVYKKALKLKRKRCNRNECNNSKEYLCEHCGFTTFYRKVFSSHKIKHLENEHSCQLCPRRFPTISRLNFHMPIHTITKLCHFCGKTIEAQYFTKHVKSHLPKAPGILPCDKCNFRASSQKLLLRHKERSHETNQKVYCSICLEGFQRQELFEKHFAAHRTKTPKAILSYVCECNIVFKNFMKYNAHLRDFHGARSYNCRFCAKKFMARRSLSRHNKKCHKNVG